MGEVYEKIRRERERDEEKYKPIKFTHFFDYKSRKLWKIFFLFSSVFCWLVFGCSDLRSRSQPERFSPKYWLSSLRRWRYWCERRATLLSFVHEVNDDDFSFIWNIQQFHIIFLPFAGFALLSCSVLLPWHVDISAAFFTLALLRSATADYLF